MNKLKPCPFCGSEDVSVDAGYWDSHGARYEVGCDNPQCAVHPCSDLYPTEAEAIDAWNTRAERTCKRITLGLEREREVATVSWICSACGKHINKDHDYCHNCGAKVVGE